MDPVTQGLIGSTLSQAFTQNKLRAQAAVIGCVAGIVPDLDILIRHTQSNPLMNIYYHRHFTHSLFFVPIGGLIVALIFLGLFPSLRPKWRWVVVAAILGYGTHGLLDAFTSFGTLLYWPFSYSRIHWDLVSIIDPVYTSILLVGVVLSLGLRKQRYALLALLLSCSYFAFNGYLHNKAVTTQRELIQSRHQLAQKRRVLPLIFHPFVWRSLYTTDNHIYIDDITLHFKTQNTHTFIIKLPLFKEAALPNFVKSSPNLMQDYRLYHWFSDGFLTTLGHSPFILTDARYILGTIHPVALWGIQFIKGAPYIKPLRHIQLRPHGRLPKQTS